ncbi:flagellar hook-length control protein FliK [Actinokineospora cianjurensis]|uniref:Flagellar hook-length control protein FliK n=1 Tax=Actinokineospora cianjurensis TaxID=585224 RepID=A0A421AUR7_9PSEU|nr:flagellar hook-length control protein FliK [Actinokineospora cianjurensis]RLK53653.1 flagellar hook-length control protein FliK [Actinokineospora cianjurensis]
MTIPGFTPASTRPTTAAVDAAQGAEQSGSDTAPAFADLLQSLAVPTAPVAQNQTPAPPTAVTPIAQDSEEQADASAELMSAMVVPTLGLPLAVAQPVTATARQATDLAITPSALPADGAQTPAAAASQPAAAAVSTGTPLGEARPAANQPAATLPGAALSTADLSAAAMSTADPSTAAVSTADLLTANPLAAAQPGQARPTADAAALAASAQGPAATAVSDASTPIPGATGAEQVPNGSDRGVALQSPTTPADKSFVDNATTLSAQAPNPLSGTVRAEAQQTAPVDGVPVATPIPAQASAEHAKTSATGTAAADATSPAQTAPGEVTARATGDKSTKDDSAKDSSSDNGQAAPGVDTTAQVEQVQLSTPDISVDTTPVHQSTQDQTAVAVPVAGVAPVDMARVQTVDTPAAPQAPHAPVHTQNAHQLAAELSPLRGHNGEHELTVHLHPVDLGPVSLTARISGGDIHIDLGSATDAGREALRAALPELRRELEKAGFGSCQLSDSGFAGTGQGTGDQWSQRAQWDQWTAAAADRARTGATQTSQAATSRSTGPAAPARTAGVLDLHA